MSRPRAGLDLDGCLYNWESRTRELVYRHTGKMLPTSTHYDDIKNNSSPECWKWLWSTQVEEMFSSGEGYGDGIAAARVLADTHDLVFITKRPRGARVATLEWLAAQRLPAAEVHVLEDVDAKKSAIACDFYVDDSTTVVEELAAAGKLVYLLDRPWNQPCTAGQRVKSWYDILVHRGVTR